MYTKEIEDNIFYNQIVPFFNNYPEDVKKIINEKKYTDVLTYYYNNTNNNATIFCCNLFLDYEYSCD